MSEPKNMPLKEHDSRKAAAEPAQILCQHANGSCGACCGVYNFYERDEANTHRRLRRRTALVKSAWPNPKALERARDILMKEEKDDVLFAHVLVCPFAGFVDEEDDERVGCLLHPTRHPEGEDLRDLSVYPKEICRDHFCAPHDWLRPREIKFAQSVRGVDYGRIVTDAGLVKALLILVEEALGRSLKDDDFQKHPTHFDKFWQYLLKWPHRDSDPYRFGAFFVTGDDAVERTLPSALEGYEIEASTKERTVLNGLSTEVEDKEHAERALSDLRACIGRLVRSVDAS